MNSLVILVRRGSALASRRWRILYAAALIAGVSGMLTGFVVAARILTGSGLGLVSVGTVTMRVNGSGTQVCDYGLLAPGDLTGSATCTLSVTYRGSIPAHLALTVIVRSRAGSGGALLYDGTNTAGLTMRLSDGHHRFTVPTGPGSTGKPCPAGFTCWAAQDDLAAPHGRSGGLLFRRGDTVTFILSPLFIAATGNRYQGGEATVALIAQAVQAPANPLPATCNAKTIGDPCPASGTFTWR